MYKLAGLVLCVLLVSCGRCETRCIDGHVYRKDNVGNFWVQVNSAHPVECKS